jgi:hypothetical protein
METNGYPAIGEIKKRLAVFPDLPIIQEGNSLYIEPKDMKGFKVIIDDNRTEFSLFCDGWSYDQFTDPKLVARTFVLALSPASRLLVREKNQQRYWWLLELCLNNEWGGIEVTFRPGKYSFFQKKKSYYLQNDWIDIDKLKPWIGVECTAVRTV